MCAEHLAQVREVRGPAQPGQPADRVIRGPGLPQRRQLRVREPVGLPGGHGQAQPAARGREAGHRGPAAGPRPPGQVDEQALGDPGGRLGRLQAGRPQRGRPVVPQVARHRDPLAARHGVLRGQHLVLGVQHVRGVHLEAAGARRPGQPERPGVEPRAEQHHLAAAVWQARPAVRRGTRSGPPPRPAGRRPGGPGRPSPGPARPLPRTSRPAGRRTAGPAARSPRARIAATVSPVPPTPSRVTVPRGEGAPAPPGRAGPGPVRGCHGAGPGGGAGPVGAARSAPARVAARPWSPGPAANPRAAWSAKRSASSRSAARSATVSASPFRPARTVQQARISGRAQIAPASRADLVVCGRDVLAVARHDRVQPGWSPAARRPEQERERIQPRPAAGAGPVHQGQAAVRPGDRIGRHEVRVDERLRQVRAAVRAVQFGPQRGQQRLLIRGQPGGGLVQQRPGRGDLGGRAALVYQVMPASAVADPVTGQRAAGRAGCPAGRRSAGCRRPWCPPGTG